MGNTTILVIEDNALNMKLVRSLLQIGGYTVLEATDAEAGIRVAQEHRPDLILMDLQLPGMDGLCATRLIKKDRTLQDIPIVALTSYAMEGDEEQSQEAGCIGYITKPIATGDFLKTVSRYLPCEDSEESP